MAIEVIPLEIERAAEARAEAIVGEAQREDFIEAVEEVLGREGRGENEEGEERREVGVQAPGNIQHPTFKGRRRPTPMRIGLCHDRHYSTRTR